MAAQFNNQRFAERKTLSSDSQNQDSQCLFYSPGTGIYSSKHPPMQLPTDPFLDVVSFIFSHSHHGCSALIDSSTGSSIPYSQLFPLVKSMAFGLRELGISKGDVILILLPNSIYFPIVVLGVLYLGAIVAPMNPLSSFSEIKKQTIDCRVCLAFATTGNVNKLKELGVKAIEVPEYVKTGDEVNDRDTFWRLISYNHESIFRPPITQDDVAAIMNSSGTTGSSKSVVLVHRNFIAMVELFVRFEASQYREEISWENVYLAVVPMFHIYGLSLFVMGLLSLGTSIVVMRKFDINQAVRAIEKYNVSHFPLVPLILAALTAKAKRAVGGSSLRSLKQVSCGAAALTKRVIEDFVHGLPHVDFIQGYGMTETTAVGTRGFNVGMVRKHTSIGLLAPNMQAKVVDCNTGSCMPPGKAGELWLRGPAVMKGYLNDWKATTSAIEKDGWLHTGDIIYFDHDGYLYIVDRLKDIIKYKGFQIAPADLEAVLLSHPDILDAAVTGVPDEEAGEVPVAFVVKSPESMLSQDAIIKHVANQVAAYKKVRRVVFVPTIQKSPTGKVLRRQLRHLCTSKI
ncbi:hypothetical protein Nepgr_030632 [Nepenthes gracilis]|uniref:4-coumarate--CoA ligase n=1 Tax=Nepenthes gracilis TaxID=150966 RepID=A0AAD3TGM1_NEPGR|nr:hypothetical protein Nepgr_030632 [Nepenthes gracilis]